jgi:anaerobic selenocysteine-containing dehydrogenase
MSDERVAYRTCPLCEATCGLEVTVGADGRVERIRGDADDVFSHGFLCPKGTALADLQEDPDRVREPLLRQADGTFRAVSWDEAFAEIDRRLPAIAAEHGRDAVGAYIGNPSAHALGPMVYGRVLLKALGTKSLFSASTVDQFPKQMASALMFGTPASVPIPDLDRTSFLLMLGANPMASNGSLMTAPDVRGRLRAIRARGGRIVVVDPRRTRTAQEADEHVAILPGTDALLLMAMVHVLFAEDLVTLGACDRLVAGLDEVREAAAAFAPEAVAGACGVDGDVIRRLARELAAAESGVVYGRIGTTTQAFGTTASWLVDVLNVLSGNLDRPGGAMFSLPAVGSPTTRGEPGRGRGASFGRYGSRVRGLGEIFGELPVAAMAEEIDTPGPGQIRALVTIAGNPVVSTPNSTRLDAALAGLDFMVSVDIYVNETTRHADVILPAPAPLEKAHYDLLLSGFGVRDVANWSEPVLAPPDGMLEEWQTLLRLTGVVTGQGPDADVGAIDDFVAREAVRREAATPGSVIAGAGVDAVLGALAPLAGPERMVDLLLRTGPYGAGFPSLGLEGPGTLSLEALRAAPHGIDLGALKPRLPGVLRTRSGLVELAPEQLLGDVPRLAAAMDAVPEDGELLLVGRRDLRSNNSWMHNLGKLVSGPARCTVWVHPDDAARLDLVDGEEARVRGRVGEIALPVTVTEDIRPGVVSIPHGWGHDLDGATLGVAAEHAGANSNVLTDEELLEPLSGTAVLNGIPVTLAPVAAAVA